MTIDWQGNAPLRVEVPPGGTVVLVCKPTRDRLAAAHAAHREYDAIMLRCV